MPAVRGYRGLSPKITPLASTFLRPGSFPAHVSASAGSGLPQGSLWGLHVSNRCVYGFCFKPFTQRVTRRGFQSHPSPLPELGDGARSRSPFPSSRAGATPAKLWRGQPWRSPPRRGGTRGTATASSPLSPPSPSPGDLPAEPVPPRGTRHRHPPLSSALRDSPAPAGAAPKPSRQYKIDAWGAGAGRYEAPRPGGPPEAP